MPDKSYLPKSRQKLTPEKLNTRANAFVTIFLGRFSLEAINFIFPGWVIIWLQHLLQMNT